MADSNDILNLIAGRNVSRDELNQVTPHFQKATAAVDQYARLMSGNGYDFNVFQSPVEGVANNRTPLIPMVLSLLPPKDLPTSQMVTRQISAPQTANVRPIYTNTQIDQVRGQDSSVQVNLSRYVIAGPTGQLTEQDIPVDSNGNPVDLTGQPVETPVAIRTPEELTAYINAADSQEERLDRIAAGTASLEEQEEYRRRNDYYLTSLRDRVDSFRSASASSTVQLNDLNTRTSADGTSFVDDNRRNNAHIKDARKRAVQDSLDELRRQIELIQSLPPLFMYINPATFTKSYDFIHSDGNKTREGHTVEFWGESQPKLAASGVVGAFYTHTFDKTGRPAGGLSVANRRGSYAYQNFMNLFQVYRNNGYLYQTDNNVRRISLVGAVSLFYDGVLYTGSFDSFTIGQSEENPFTMEYNFVFTVRFEQSIRDRYC